ncbi:MAG: outer membrane beta-barrel protein [Gammaproteobacteria bacterium]|nr:outer membrane beta-barrel protein [Gammaproteobacteria bacterium]
MIYIAKKQNIAWIALALPLLIPISAGAAQNVLSGEVVLGQDYDSNINRESSAKQSEWRTTITPGLTVTHSEPTNTFTIKYAPTVVYSYLTDDKRIDQFVSGRYDISLAQKLLVYFQDTYILSDDPYADPLSSASMNQRDNGDMGIQISDQRGRNRYWTNNFTTGASYEYAQESFVKLGYQYHILDNKDPEVADFVKHSPNVSILHRLNHQWASQLDYRFVKGDFDKSGDLAADNAGLNENDLITNTSDLYLYYNLTPFTKIFGHYGYSQTDFDGLQDDYNAHTMAAGTDHQFSPTLNLSGEGGMSLLQRDNFSNTDAMYLRIALNKTWERSSLSLSADSGLDQQYFSSTNDQGLSRYWAVRSAFNYTFIKDVTGTASLSYRENTYLDRVPQEKEQQLQGDALLAYSFARWYQIAFRYTYINQDADLETDQYDDHRILLQLSAANDLFKW